jgi:hypothetical protein
MWLLHGKGSKYRSPATDRLDTASHGVSVGSLLRTALQMLEQGESTPPTFIVSKSPAERHAGDEHSEVVLLAVDDTSEGPITSTSGPRYIAARAEWLDAERECRCIRIEGTAMSPIVADGAYVAFSKNEESAGLLDGKMVVAWVDNHPVVRWFQHCGRYAVLRAENPNATPAQIPIDLDDRARAPRFRRVLWINTPH